MLDGELLLCRAAGGEGDSLDLRTGTVDITAAVLASLSVDALL